MNAASSPMPGLAVGQYRRLMRQKTGFKRAVASRDIAPQVNQNAEASFALEVGQVAETIEVTGQEILVDAGSATLGNAHREPAGERFAAERAERAGVDAADTGGDFERGSNELGVWRPRNSDFLVVD
jgi:ribulose 1,5-bisphosphate carboxylase large subunit-like protein